VTRKVRLETYVSGELESQINDAAEDRGISTSAFLREAARHELQAEEINNE
jgi:hypothetical protein